MVELAGGALSIDIYRPLEMIVSTCPSYQQSMICMYVDRRMHVSIRSIVTNMVAFPNMYDTPTSVPLLPMSKTKRRW